MEKIKVSICGGARQIETSEANGIAGESEPVESSVDLMATRLITQMPYSQRATRELPWIAGVCT